MKRLLVCLVCIALLPCRSAWAQDATATTEQLIADIFEQYSQETEEDLDYNTFYEDLMAFAQTPVNLNNTTREELEHLPFLSDIQIENILAYIYQFGKLQTIYELQLIDGLDMTDIRRMLPFVVVGEQIPVIQKVYWSDVKKYGKNDLYVRFDQGLETKQGYTHRSDEDQSETGAISTDYLGSALYHSVKYRFHFKDRILAGLTTEKDAGEQFWGLEHKGYDFYSIYAQVNNIGKLKTLVVGDFRAGFGSGLVVKSGFSMGKSSYVLNVIPHNTGLKKYSSTDEYNFFRGVGATFRQGKLDISAFYSNKKIDGDTLNGTFSGLIKSGYHRTESEMDKRLTINQQVLGANAELTFQKFQIGTTVVQTMLDSRLEPEKTVYNHFYFSGKYQTTVGIHYRANWHNLNFFGETAATDNLSIATLNGLLFSPVSVVSLVALFRYYSPQYDTFYANSFGETSRVNNESGFYLGAEIRPVKRWKISAYADSYRFPWPKYGIDAPSTGYDYFFQADFSTQRNLSMYWRIKSEEKQSNFTGSVVVMPVVVTLQKTSFRYQLNYTFRNFTFKNTLEGNLSQKGDAALTYGIIAAQDIGYDFTTIPLKIDLRFAVFDAPDFENRIYSYEKDILYAFSIPMYCGVGSRYYINLKYDLNDQFSIWLKLAQTVYADERETLGNGNETITGNRKTDFRLMFRWAF